VLKTGLTKIYIIIFKLPNHMTIVMKNVPFLTTSGQQPLNRPALQMTLSPYGSRMGSSVNLLTSP
jgi:hypothetical protein